VGRVAVTVAVVANDRQGVGGDRAGGDVSATPLGSLIHMMFPTLPVMEQAYLAWASEHPHPDTPASAATSTTVDPVTSPSADPQPSG
jgi:hypothetical protein